MLALEGVAGLLVIEGREVPLDQRKIFPVMLRVAAGALLTGPGLNVVRSMQAFVCGDPRGNFCMARQTAERRLATRELMARRAIRGAGQELMGPSQRAGGNLRSGRSSQNPTHR